MSEERITERTDAAGHVTERVIERGSPDTNVVERRGGGGGAVIFGLILLFAIGIGAFFLFDMSKSETRKDDAVSQAADKIGAGAKKVGDAAEKAADKLGGDESK